jgi:hypothetical protein
VDGGHAAVIWDRRRVLQAGAGLGALGVGAAALAACGDGETTETSGGNPANALIAAFPRSVPYLAAGVPTRLPFLVADQEGIPLAKIRGPVTFRVTAGDTAVGSPIRVTPHDDGVPKAYLPVAVTFPNPGIYDLTADYEGEPLTSSVQVYDAAQVPIPGVGQALPPADTPTMGRSLGVDPVCSRSTPCPFHEVNLRDVMGSGRPKVVLVATPAYCQTAVCGPIVDLLVEQAAGRTDLDVIHAEVYKNPKAVRDLNKAALSPLPDEYRLPFEPTMFVTDATGTIVARADITVDRVEMQELLALAQ